MTEEKKDHQEFADAAMEEKKHASKSETPHGGEEHQDKEDIEDKQEEQEEQEQGHEDKSATLVSPLEDSLPENTKERPHATIFKLDKADLQQHQRYVRTFPKNTDVKGPLVPKYTEREKLNEEGDELEYLKTSPKGENKVTKNGHLVGGRKYLMNTFTLPGRGKKLYVLATEAARTLINKDAFVLFNRVKQIHKSITTDQEKQFLEETGLILSRMKARTVGVITAKSLFMYFGAKVVQCGKRIQDDYWEEEATEQGFTVSDHVFPVDRNYHGPRNSHKPKETTIKKKVTKPLTVAPIPSLEERKEYLQQSITGGQVQVLPGQGITGGLELTAVSSVPKYRNDGSNNVPKHKNILGKLLDTGSSTTPAPVAIHVSNKLPVNDEYAGVKSANGLPYYKKNIMKRVSEESAERLNEIEYLHSTVELNNFISINRAPRNRQWQFYWQVKSGAKLGLTKENSEEFFKEREEFMQKVDEEVRVNEYLPFEEIVTRRKIPNPNYLGNCNITGLKPPYLEKPIDETMQINMQMNVNNSGLPQQMQTPLQLQQLQQQQQQSVYGVPQAYQQNPMIGNRFAGMTPTGMASGVPGVGMSGVPGGGIPGGISTNAHGISTPGVRGPGSQF